MPEIGFDHPVHAGLFADFAQRRHLLGLAGSTPPLGSAQIVRPMG